MSSSAGVRAHIEAFHRDKGWRLSVKENALLALMADQAWHGPDEMEDAGGRRYGARLYDLRHKYGYRFTKREVAPGEWHYRLEGKQRTPATSPVLAVPGKDRADAKTLLTAGLSWEEAIGS